MKARKSNQREAADRLRPGAVAGGLAVAALAAGALAARTAGWEHAPTPFVWSDVVLVHFVAALPLAAMLAAAIRLRVSTGGALVLAGIALAAGGGLVFYSSVLDADAMAESGMLAPAIRRSLPALSLAVAAVLVLLAALGGGQAADRRPGKIASGGLAVAIAVWVLVPGVYVAARLRHDTQQLTALLEQSRLGEARRLAHALLDLNPAAQWQGRPLRPVARDLDRLVRELESRVAVPLEKEADDAARFERARELAILGHTGAAINVLHSWPEWESAAEACNLCGTIYESSGDWERGVAAYRAAQRACAALPSLDERTAALVHAATGVGYCERKRGRYAEAEAAYQEVLALAPTAESHFLLARFYEDTQQAAKAQNHARQAMALDPDRYQTEGQRLIDKLVTHHFGCWSVFRTERNASSASLGAPAPR